MIKDFFFFSVSNLRRRKLRAWLTMIGIFIGIAAVVSLITLGQGLRDAITGQFSTLSADTLIIQNAESGFGPPGSTAVKKLNDHDLKIVGGVRGVKTAVPRMLRVVKIEFKGNIAFNYLINIPESGDSRDVVDSSITIEFESGRELGGVGDYGRVVLGHAVAYNSNFDRPIRSGDKVKIQNKDFEVIGILKPSGSFQINQVILMLEGEMKDLLNIEDEIDFIVVQVENIDDVETVAESIKEKLRKDRKEKVGEEDFSVQTPLQSIESVNTILNIINIIVSGIAAISLLVGGIGISNTMFTSVLERRKEIGTMKAIGARNQDILMIFLIEAGLLGFIGGLIGASLGIGMAYGVSAGANTAFGSEILKFSLSLPLVFAAISFSCIVGIVSGLIPAYQGSKLKPVDALRG